MVSLVSIAYLAGFLLLPAEVSAKTPERLFAQLEFLLGDWEAVSATEEGTGSSSFALELQGRVMVRRNHAEYPAEKGRPASRHDDLMIISVEEPSGPMRAIYFDNEGHVIPYVVDAKSGTEVTFVSDVTPKTARYRLTYRLLSENRLSGRFEIAPPSAPEAFKTYLKWEARRSGSEVEGAPSDK